MINPKIVIVGEAAGNTEVIEGKPFIGKAGKLLRETLEKNGINKENSLITNTLPCRPIDNKFPTNNELVKNCVNKWLKEEILLTKPDLILLIGAKPLKLCLKENSITKVRGNIYTKFFGEKTIKVMATYHPSYVLRKMYMAEGKQIREDFEKDIQKAYNAISSLII